MFPTTNTTKYLTLFSVIAVAGATLYRSTLTKVAQAGIAREDSSHTVFIPFIVIYFLWTTKDSILKKEHRIEWPGFVLLACIIMLTYATRTAAYQLHYFLFVALILSAIFALLGRHILAAAAFPVIFLVAATPIPEQLYNDVANISRTIALSASLKITSILGVPYYREGWIVQIPTGLMSVNINCSGIRYLLSYFVFSMAYAYLFKKTAIQRMATIISSIPISIIASTLRLTSIFTLSYYIDPRFSDKWPHIILSWTVFVTVMAISIAIDWTLMQKRDIQCKDSEKVKCSLESSIP